MIPEIVKELVRFKHAELTCLGIAPPLYYNACKLLDRHITVVIKDGIIYQFVNEKNSELLSDNFDKKDKRFQYEDAVNLIGDVFSLDVMTCHNIVKEWRRDKMINSKMYEQVSKYWKYISLPEKLDGEDYL